MYVSNRKGTEKEINRMMVTKKELEDGLKYIEADFDY